ncbi:hypothetical protein M407DRAFT_85849 [Tulasnella calospora MUT 4182]|uniref:Uncharacterized protein n=1 Tax=Tulasnella calospora MUT 4182 TaxID=1051891 RepID=A0A0C3L4P5_9AGAM|nr:hypothetical protein M407DRAFT_85849 [Tulasnella calospora MUT 4182]
MSTKGSSPYEPFKSRIDYSVAKWAKELGPGDTALSKLLEIPGVVEALGLSWRNARQLNQIIDHHLPNLASWTRLEFKLEGTEQVIECFYRDPLECVESLYGNPAWADVLHVAPERHYTNETKATRMYNEMYTGNWWWRQQVSSATQRFSEIDSQLTMYQAKLKAGATVIPIIVSSDKTSLKVLSTGKEAYPAYLTIGNIPKSIRRKPSMHAQLLFAYLPTEQFTGTTLSKEQIRLAKNRAFHFAMKRIFESLESAGKDGVELGSGDGKVRHCYPLLAVYVADYPEQCLVTCTRYTHCPLCRVGPGQLGEYGKSEKRSQMQTLQKMDEATRAATKALANSILREAGITDTPDPFFSDLPFANINRSITPDILHQLYQGLIKHLTGWISRIIGPKELDLRFARLPPNHALRIFKDGISGFSRLSGNEHRQIAKQLLGCIIGRAPPGAIRASRALLDFLYIAQFETHTDRSLEKLEHALRDFHDNKQVFLDTNAPEDFDFPKLHSLLHYAPQIREFGTTDNYNTENTERLHIDMAKDAYRATNRKDILPQMVLWLERKEKIFAFSSYIEWRLGLVANTAVQKKLSAKTYTNYHWITLSKTPSVKHATLAHVAQTHGAPNLRRVLESFVSMRQRYLGVPRTPLPSSLVLSIWYHFKISNLHLEQLAILDNSDESVHASPSRAPQRSQKILPARFDTVLVNEMWDGRDVGLRGYRIARVRAVFTLQSDVTEAVFGSADAVQQLAYVEWYSRLTTPGSTHGMYSVQPSIDTRGQPDAAVIELGQIRQSVHLFPKFPKEVLKDHGALEWTSETVLDRCSDFFVNRYLSRHSFQMLVN